MLPPILINPQLLGIRVHDAGFSQSQDFNQALRCRSAFNQALRALRDRLQPMAQLNCARNARRENSHESCTKKHGRHLSRINAMLHHEAIYLQPKQRNQSETSAARNARREKRYSQNNRRAPNHQTCLGNTCSQVMRSHSTERAT